MSQDDLLIANQAFPATRSDINSNLQALGSVMSGAAAPATTYAYMWWADTTNGVLKQRDSTNASWVIRATLGTSPLLAKSATYSLVLADIGKTILCDATGGVMSINLLAAATAGNGYAVTIKKKDSSANAVTIQGNGAENIDLANTIVITNQDEEYTVISDGTQYWVIGGGATLFRAQTFTGAQRVNITALTSSSNSIAVDFSANNDFSHTFTENTTLANPSNLVAGQSGAIFLTQHASSPKTLAFGSKYKFASGVVPTVSAVNSAADTLYYHVRSSTFIECNLVKGLA